jgi:hypothetical protein
MSEIYNNCPVEPYKVSNTAQQSHISNLNYTNQDFWSMKTRLIQLCQERFGPSGNLLPNSFNDFVESDLAIMLIENFAFLADLLSFKMDQIVNELGIDTVTEIENAFRLAKQVGFIPLPPISASSMWSATIAGSAQVDIEITTPIPIDLNSNNQPITIELFAMNSNNEPMFDDPIIIPAGQTINTSIIGLEGVTKNVRFIGNGGISQTYSLSENPVIYNSIQVQVDGMIWEQVEAFTDSQPRQEYRVEFDSTWTAYIIFGNNRAGLIPSNASRIDVRYRTGGGVIGNIVTGYVNDQILVSVSNATNNTTVTLTNYTRGKYGYNGDTIEDIRNKLPKWTKIQDRAVSGSDYKTFTDQFANAYHGQIGKSVAVLRNQGCAGNIIDLYVLAKNGVDNLEIASNNLKFDLSNAINSIKMLTDFVCIKDGIIIPVEINITATLDKFYKKYQEDVKQNIINTTLQFFSINQWEYGQTLKSIDLIKALASIKQIDNCIVSFHLNDGTTTEEVHANFYEIVRPSNSLPIIVTFI